MLQKVVIRVGLIAALGALFAGCASDLQPDTLGPQLEEVRRLSDELGRNRDAADADLQVADASIDAFMKRRVVSGGVDVALLRLSMMECLTAKAVQAEPSAGAMPDEGLPSGPAAKPCQTRSTQALEAHLENVEPGDRDIVVAQLQSIATARKALKSDIPQKLARVGRLYVETQARIVDIRETADTIKTAAASNPSMGEEELSIFRENFQELTGRLDELNKVLESVRTDLETTTPEVQEGLETLAYAISVYGLD